MSRTLIIIISGIAVAVAAFCGLYFAGTAPHRSMLHGETPELAWLKTEFRLSDAEFERVTALHEGYLPRCEEMCRRIAEKNGELEALLKTSSGMTPEIEQKLQEANALRVECHKGMLEHFYEVSRAMPPEQGRRYLEWVQQQTVLSHQGMLSGNHDHHE